MTDTSKMTIVVGGVAYNLVPACEEKVQPILFRTEDGHDVYEGQMYYSVRLEDKSTFLHLTAESGWDYSDRVKFHHKENALKYIEDNKPRFSKTQILDAFHRSVTLGDLMKQLGLNK